MSSNELDDLYINRYAGRVEDPTEVLMRADFDRAKDLSETAFHAESDQDIDRIFDKVDEISVRWSSRDDDYGVAYRYLSDAYSDWKSSPDTMRRLHEQIAVDEAQGAQVWSGIQWRSQQHARELTGNGVWVVEPRSIEQARQQLAAIERAEGWSDPAEARPAAAPVPVSGSFAAARTAELSALADYGPGSSLADALTHGTDREGMER
ncbi:hypothetical protein IU459_13160 [Nocardia amamiensis]|uniref:Uncharacterized protein n=1 Tax=Nocardia amamiensis TaxID=404578 RepID=A0ABS0CRR6_9NOCA|nr:hypothetical protein [Nocardia amamiensis]MBF6298487.1 hypothetical protein [Nocardia amamiensis]